MESGVLDITLNVGTETVMVVGGSKCPPQLYENVDVSSGAARPGRKETKFR